MIESLKNPLKNEEYQNKIENSIRGIKNNKEIINTIIESELSLTELAFYRARGIRTEENSINFSDNYLKNDANFPPMKKEISNKVRLSSREELKKQIPSKSMKGIKKIVSKSKHSNINISSNKKKPSTKASKSKNEKRKSQKSMNKKSRMK